DEIRGTGSASKAVERAYGGLLARLGPELFILGQAPVEDIAHASSSLLAEAVLRMREGRVIREAGYDGEYGVIRLFRDDELRRQKAVGTLFDDGGFAPQPAPVAPPAPLLALVSEPPPEPVLHDG